jgi:hypothetical protein
MLDSSLMRRVAALRRLSGGALTCVAAGTKLCVRTHERSLRCSDQPDSKEAHHRAAHPESAPVCLGRFKCRQTEQGSLRVWTRKRAVH